MDCYSVWNIKLEESQHYGNEYAPASNTARICDEKGDYYHEAAYEFFEKDWEGLLVDTGGFFAGFIVLYAVEVGFTLL